MLGSVSAWMDDHLQMDKPLQHKARHLGLLSLRHPFVGMHSEYSSKAGGVNRHIA